MMAALTGRRLKSGAFDDWRKAWMPEGIDVPAGLTAYILRKVGDPDEVIAFGMFEGSREDIHPDPAAEEARVEGMAPFVESVFVDGIYEVVEVVES